MNATMAATPKQITPLIKQSASSILNLPPELRSIIFTYGIIEDEPIAISRQGSRRPDLEPIRSMFATPRFFKVADHDEDGSIDARKERIGNPTPDPTASSSFSTFLVSHPLFPSRLPPTAHFPYMLSGHPVWSYEYIVHPNLPATASVYKLFRFKIFKLYYSANKFSVNTKAWHDVNYWSTTESWCVVCDAREE
jgi:hypothetical protein